MQVTNFLNEFEGFNMLTLLCFTDEFFIFKVSIEH